MPARHDTLAAALDFLWRPRVSIEVREDAITRSLRQSDVLDAIDNAGRQMMPGTDVPVVCQPLGSGDRLPFWPGDPPAPRLCSTQRSNPNGEENPVGTPIERELIDAMVGGLKAIGEPGDVFERLGTA
ncbi:MAG: hypothetical protein ACRDVW_09445 [Acidimicrobiales bacterium]